MKKIPLLRSPSVKLCLMTLALLTACETSRPLVKTELAQRVAAPAWMIRREIPAGSYLLTAYERIHDYNSTVNVYIEGNGPTPEYPTALHLATKDKTDNIIYLAQPCQYSGLIKDDSECTLTGEQAYAPTSLEAMNAALDEIAKRYNVRGFHLIGYDGGATIATNLAASRKDILSLRTVAGIMDTDAYNDAHGWPRTKNAQNPALKAATLSNLPQYHFIGGQDAQVPPSVLHSYFQALPPTRCVRYELIQENEHEDGWVEKWPDLLKRPVNCNGAVPQDFNALDLVAQEGPAPYETVREIPEKP
ncbi:MAG: hypothetical protein KA099_06355 [Alphaproteobacteria bacterium]|nr:hypothetical protein [Alphaproteobacteria bacterium]MBP7759897.1 hypothetical protein [Alphaproteobacteria bacterium]MBP7763260.1 hypothetical protein [Alphaproteobacteria bacterium]MBP7904931.1 hypothetical protein [Alphaproteobacteria bacterium]